MRYTRASVPEDELYLASTAVLMSEVIKTSVCFGVVYSLLPFRIRSLSNLALFLYQELIIHWRESIKLAIPAILYLVQNNLQYIAATNLDAATFQVTYQLKILTTAFFSVVILHRKLSSTKWTALAILTVGIIFVVIPKNALNTWLGYETVETESIGNQSNLKGIVSVLVACILSGLAGVYFEKIVKQKEQDLEGHYTKPERVLTIPFDDRMQLWIRNIQLSLFSVLLGGVFMVGLQDGHQIIQQGFFQHYSTLTWIVILIQAGGGLIVGLVVRYADNILKGFATSISIILSSIVSVWLFQAQVDLVFGMGALLVIYATYLYSKSS
ncbi:nucleotide-sugar transporter [Gilbertella persicaria]|uniref:nucleotide-sugar transporter n=1 Tax=Gilbertella persicaria TaxID=101096 RepID=UPI002220411C|nr:nucleotide-sugar transporter [Gilbertella persicaria]KAI8052564.1 nucleotide-sugar transporter [Gilbertella persicaria]